MLFSTGGAYLEIASAILKLTYFDLDPNNNSSLAFMPDCMSEKTANLPSVPTAPILFAKSPNSRLPGLLLRQFLTPFLCCLSLSVVATVVNPGPAAKTVAMGFSCTFAPTGCLLPSAPAFNGGVAPGAVAVAPLAGAVAVAPLAGAACPGAPGAGGIPALGALGAGATGATGAACPVALAAFSAFRCARRAFLASSSRCRASLAARISSCSRRSCSFLASRIRCSTLACSSLVALEFLAVSSAFSASLTASPATAACSATVFASSLVSFATTVACWTAGASGGNRGAFVVGSPPATGCAPTVFANRLTASLNDLAAISCILAAPLNVLTTLSMVKAAPCCARPASTINLVSPPAPIRLPCSVSKNLVIASGPVNPALAAPSANSTARFCKSSVAVTLV